MSERVKPKLRGVSHQLGFFLSLVPGLLLIRYAPAGQARVSVAVFALSLSGLLGTSALYHRIDWSPAKRAWMRRLDRSMIFVLIAGTYTPIAVMALPAAAARRTLGLVWAGGVLGVLVHLFWPRAPKWLTAATYLIVGWGGAWALPQLLETMGSTAFALLAIGGVVYSAGAAVYAAHRPDPWPDVFGYHEIFHLFVLVAAGAHFAAVALVL